jgi:hypothetical protein
MGRLGLKELANYLPAFNNGQTLLHEPGLAGNVVPQEVLDQKLQGFGRGMPARQPAKDQGFAQEM